MPQSCSDAYYFHVIYEYLVHMGMDMTARTMLDECDFYSYPCPYLTEMGVSMDEINQLLQHFDDEKCAEFYKLFDMAVPAVVQDTTDCRKLKLALHVYFAVSGLRDEKDPKHGKARPSIASQSNHDDSEGGLGSAPCRCKIAECLCRADIQDNDDRKVMKPPMCGKAAYYTNEYRPDCRRHLAHPCMSVLLAFLERDGSELSKEPELLPYFALPYILDPESHPHYEHLFKPPWTANLRRWLWDFLIANRQAGKVPELVVLLSDRQIVHGRGSRRNCDASDVGIPRRGDICVNHTTSTLHGKQFVRQYHPKGSHVHESSEHPKASKPYLSRDCEDGHDGQGSKLTSGMADDTRQSCDGEGSKIAVTFNHHADQSKHNPGRDTGCPNERPKDVDEVEICRQLMYAQLESSYNQLHSDYHSLLAIAAELTDALEDAVRGKPVDLKATLDRCLQLYPELVRVNDEPKGSSRPCTSVEASTSAAPAHAEKKNRTSVVTGICETGKSSGVDAGKTGNAAQEASASDDKSGNRLQKIYDCSKKRHDPPDKNVNCDNRHNSHAKSSVEAKSCTGSSYNPSGRRLGATEKNDSAPGKSNYGSEKRGDPGERSSGSKPRRQNVAEKSNISSSHRRFNADIVLGGRCRNKDLVSNVSQTSRPRQTATYPDTEPLHLLPIYQLYYCFHEPVGMVSWSSLLRDEDIKHQFDFNLDVDNIKTALRLECVEKKIYLLHVLRKSLVAADAEPRKAACELLLNNDVLDLTRPPPDEGGGSETSLIEGFLVPRTTMIPHSLQQSMAGFLNSIATLRQGRDYLEKSDNVVKTIVHTLQEVEIDALTLEMLLATLQKLSLRKRQRELMIEANLVEWLINELAICELNGYRVKTSAALLVNLCLHSSARERCIPLARKALSAILKLINNSSLEVLPYLLVSLLNLLSIPEINSEAAEMGVERSLEEAKFIQNDEESRSELEEVLQFHRYQLRNEACRHEFDHQGENLEDSPSFIDILEDELNFDPVGVSPEDSFAEIRSCHCFSARTSFSSTLFTATLSSCDETTVSENACQQESAETLVSSETRKLCQ